jgi:hypothetical protein
MSVFIGMCGRNASPFRVESVVPTLSKIKNPAVLTPLFLVLAVCSGLFFGCENEFIKNAVDTLIPGEEPKTVNLEWNTDVVYIDPLSGTLSGTVSGLLNNQGNRVWFSANIGDSGKNWGISKPQKELEDEQKGTVPASFITAGSISGNTQVTTADGDKIEFLLHTPVDLGTLDKDLYSKDGGVGYSIVLYPNAFYGADRNGAIGEKKEHPFKVELPTKTVYSKFVMEKTEYGSVSVSWADGVAAAADTGADTWQAMMNIAGSSAVNYAVGAAQGWDPTAWGATEAGYTGITVDGGGSLAAVSWNTTPDTSKSYAAYDKYAIVLTPYFYTEESAVQSAVQPVVSLPVEFTSDVGNSVAAIKDAENAGTFSVSFATGVNTTIEGIITALAPSSTITWSPPYPEDDSTLSLPAAYTLSIAIPQGSDSSPEDTITVTVVISQGGGGGAPSE